MPPTQPPKDALGNELHEGDIITLISPKPLFFRVMKLEHGGIQTPQGITPGVLLIGVTVTMRFIPGAPLENIARVVSPGSDKVMSDILAS